MLCVWLGALPAQQPAARANDAQPLVQAGVAQYQVGDFRDAIASWQQALAQVDPDNLTHQSIILENLARAHRQIGQFSEEIAYWEQAAQRHERLGNLLALGRALTEQAQAHSRLGQHRRAIALLCGETNNGCASGSALQIARAVTDASGEAAALGSLGEAYRLTGDYQQALVFLEQSRSLIESDSYVYQAAVLNSLGNTYGALAQISTRRAQAAAKRGDIRDARELTEKAEAQVQQAVAFLQQGYEAAETGSLASAQVRSQLSLIPLYQRSDRADAARQAQQAARQLISELPDSQTKAFAAISLADYLEPTSKHQACPAAEVVSQQTELLETAAAIAQTIQNARAESFALGQLGYLHERCGNYDRALSLTQAARLAADQDRSAQDSLYLWAWQQGRILKAQGKAAAAETAYTQALAVLEEVRADILNANRELQFDFRDQVEPIYREFATLKLAKVPPSVPIATTGQSTVDTVLVTLDSLKLAELQNYFANDCVIVPAAARVDVVGEQSSTAVISTAILANRTAVIASLPDGRRQVEWIDITENSLTAEVNAFRQTLEQGRFRRVTYRAAAAQLYDQLVRPFEPLLSELQVNTLVFINDGILRSIPMSALYDGQQFLIEKYAIATTPSLTLTDPNALNRQNLNALILGLSEASQVGNTRFSPLNKVDDEIAAVEAQFSNSTVLKNENFSEPQLRKALQDRDYKILHIATHGNFGAEPEDNYIVTGQKLDAQRNKALTISELDALIRSVSTIDQAPIDLLA
ncbi:MAG: CHAT domain-containing protein, partial [Leptolyngbya sp. SIO4C1]|nr:CHAT domain-containing protein [Leptolyngbya sp. SIO4C1]